MGGDRERAREAEGAAARGSGVWGLKDAGMGWDDGGYDHEVQAGGAGERRVLDARKEEERHRQGARRRAGGAGELDGRGAGAARRGERGGRERDESGRAHV